MVITREEFEANRLEPKIQRLGRNEFEILQMLYEHKNEAFAQSEIQKKCDILYQAAVNTALKSLRKKGFVEVKSVDGINFWRAVDGETMDNICNQYKRIGEEKPAVNEVGVKKAAD